MNNKRPNYLTDSKILKQKHINNLFNKRHTEWSINLIDQRHHITNNDTDIQMTNSIVNLNLLQENFKLLTNGNFLKDKAETLRILKVIRKELSKGNLPDNIQSILLDTNKNVYLTSNQIVNVLTNHLHDFKNTEIQFESIWILNILNVYCHEHHLDLNFKSINNILISFLNQKDKFSHQGVKNLLLEKYFCLISSIIFIDNEAFQLYLNNGLLKQLFYNVNSSVRTFRNVCLWLLSKILNKMTSDLNGNYHELIDKFFDKESLSYYKFILSKIELKRNIDEIYEFYWLINDLAKIHPEILYVLFYNDKDKEIVKKFNINILEISLITKLVQPCLRLISNLIVVASNDLIRLNIITSICNYGPLMQYIKGIIENISKYDIGIVKDALVLLFNISTYIPQRVTQLLYREIGNMLINHLGNIQFQNDENLLRLSMNIYYKMHLSVIECYSQDIISTPINEELKLQSTKIIQGITSILNIFTTDQSLMLISIDLLYIYISIFLKGIIVIDAKISSTLFQLNQSIILQGTHLNQLNFLEIMNALMNYL